MKPLPLDVVEREPVQREREQGRVADQVAEARPEIRAARSISKRPISRCSRGSSVGWLADAPHLADVVLGVEPSGTSSWGGLGTSASERVALGLGRGERLLDLLQLGLHGLQLLELLGRRLPLQLGAPAARRRGGRARASARRPRAAGRTPRRRPCGRAPPGRAPGSRAALRSIIVGSLGRPRSRSATPSSCGPGHVRSAIAWRRGARPRPRPRDPRPRASSTSFSPSPKATTCGEVDPEQLGDEGDPRALRRAGMAELEEVGSDVVMKRRRRRRARGRPHLGEPLRLGDRDELRRRPLEPREEVADLGDRAGAGSPSRRASTRSPRRRRAGRRRRRSARGPCERATRSPRGRRRARAARGGGTRASAGRRRRRPGSRRPARRSRPARGTARPSGTSARSRRGPGCRPPATARSRRASAARAPASRPISVPSRSQANACTGAGSRRRRSAGGAAQPPADDELRDVRDLLRLERARRRRACRPGRA